MIALSSEGKTLIDQNHILGFYNREASVRSIQEAIDFLYLRKNELVRNSVYQALEFIRDSKSCAFICCRGLVAMVANELNDCENHNSLSEIENKLQRVWNNCWKLPVFNSSSNVIDLQAYKEYRVKRTEIFTELTHVVRLLFAYKEKNLS